MASSHRALPDSFALAALTATGPILTYIKILAAQFVAMIATSLPSVLRGRRFASFVVNRSSHRFQVAWINAYAYAAKMIQLQALGNRPNKELVGKAMRLDHLAACWLELAVSPDVYRCSPEPAGVRLIDLAPEAFFKRWRLARRRGPRGAKARTVHRAHPAPLRWCLLASRNNARTISHIELQPVRSRPRPVSAGAGFSL